MAWCFHARPPVGTVLSIYTCISSYLWVKGCLAGLFCLAGVMHSMRVTVKYKMGLFNHHFWWGNVVLPWKRICFHIFYCCLLMIWHRLLTPALTHWGRVTHICVSRLTITGSDNGLAPGRRQAIIWTNAGILLIGPLETNFSEISIEIKIFSLTNLRLKVLSAKVTAILSRPQCVNNEKSFPHYV